MLVSGMGSAREPGVAMQRVLPFPIFETQLENGLNVVTVPYNSPGVAAFYIVMRVGSREEVEPGKTGFAHFFEHMMFRGTEKYPKEKYSEELKAIGASANANTWLDRTVYHMTGNASMLDKMFELEADRFMNLKYSMQDFKTEAGAVKGEYTKNFSNPMMKLYESYADTAFVNHTYSHTTMGFIEDIIDMPNQYEYSTVFFERFYRPEYATIIVVGDVNQDNVVGMAKKYFGKWERGSYQATIPVEPAQNELKRVHMKVDNYPAQLVLSYKAPGFIDTSREAAALSLLASVIGSEKSPLYKKLVLEERKVRSFDATYFFTRDPFLFFIDVAMVNEDDLQYVKDEIDKYVREIIKKPVSKEFLEQIKSRLKYSLAMRMDSPDAIANTLSYFTWVTGDPQSVNKFYNTLKSITGGEVAAVAEKYLKPERLTLATISSSETQTIK